MGLFGTLHSTYQSRETEERKVVPGNDVSFHRDTVICAYSCDDHTFIQSYFILFYILLLDDPRLGMEMPVESQEFRSSSARCALIQESKMKKWTTIWNSEHRMPFGGLNHFELSNIVPHSHSRPNECHR